MLSRQEVPLSASWRPIVPVWLVEWSLPIGCATLGTCIDLVSLGLRSSSPQHTVLESTNTNIVIVVVYIIR